MISFMMNSFCYNSTSYENLYFSSLMENIDTYKLLKDKVNLTAKDVYGYPEFGISNSSTYDNPRLGFVASKRRGLITCAGNHQVNEVIKMAWTVNNAWGNTTKFRLGFSVAHCSEISKENQEIILKLIPNIHILDLCDISQLQGRSSIFGMSFSQATKRLRGFHCKIAALLASPYTETMLLDLDVVFFKSPHLLFRAPAYRETGTLFFRDRVYFKKIDGSKGVDIQDLRNFFGEYGVEINSTSTYRLLREGGVSLFWHYGLLPEVVMQDYQESSIVLLNKANHPVTLSILEKHLPSISLGYGDKELYWIAATAAREPFAFEPYLAGQYGDCAGVVMHYDPTQTAFLEYNNHSDGMRNLGRVGSNSSSSGSVHGVTIHRPLSPLLAAAPPEPFYLNGEFMAENGLKYVGQFIPDTLTSPVAVNPHTIEHLIAGNSREHGRIVDSNTWQGPRFVRNCTCREERYGCHHAAAHLASHVLLAQWMVFTTSLHGLGGDPLSARPNTQLAERVEADVCVPMLLNAVKSINALFSTPTMREAIRGGDCFIVGCPHLPVKVDMSQAWQPLPDNAEPAVGQYCEPVTFSFAALAHDLERRGLVPPALNSTGSSVFEEGLSALAEEARQPFSRWNKPAFPEGQLLQAENERAVYMLLNGSLHGFPGLSTVCWSSYSCYFRMNIDGFFIASSLLTWVWTSIM